MRPHNIIITNDMVYGVDTLHWIRDIGQNFQASFNERTIGVYKLLQLNWSIVESNEFYRLDIVYTFYGEVRNHNFMVSYTSMDRGNFTVDLILKELNRLHHICKCKRKLIKRSDYNLTIAKKLTGLDNLIEFLRRA